MTPAIEQGVREIPVNLNLKNMAEEFVVALDWSLKTGKRYTGEPIPHTAVQSFTLECPVGGSFLPVADQMADEIKAATNGRFGFVMLPLYRETPNSPPHKGQYTVLDCLTNSAARIVRIGDTLRFDVALVAR